MSNLPPGVTQKMIDDHYGFEGIEVQCELCKHYFFKGQEEDQDICPDCHCEFCELPDDECQCTEADDVCA